MPSSADSISILQVSIYGHCPNLCAKSLITDVRYGPAIRRRSKFSPTGPSTDEGDADPRPEVNASGRRHSSSVDEELALDEQAGVLDQAVEKEITKGDSYLDAHGVEKVERRP